MEANTTLFYYGQPEVYEKLLQYCAASGFKVKDNVKKFYFIVAKKRYILFWKNKRIELQIELVGKTQVQVTAAIFQYGKRQPTQENEFIKEIQKFF